MLARGRRSPGHQATARASYAKTRLRVIAAVTAAMMGSARRPGTIPVKIVVGLATGQRIAHDQSGEEGRLTLQKPSPTMSQPCS